MTMVKTIESKGAPETFVSIVQSLAFTLRRIGRLPDRGRPKPSRWCTRRATC